MMTRIGTLTKRLRFLPVFLFTTPALAAQGITEQHPWLPSIIFLGICGLVIVLQLIQGGYKPRPNETHDFIEAKLREYEQRDSKKE